MLVGGAKAAAGAATVAMNLWLAAHLPPSAFGVFATATAALLLSDAVFGSAMDAAVIRTTDRIPAEAVTPAERDGLLLKLGAVAGAGAIAAAIASMAASMTTLIIVLTVALGAAGVLIHRSVLLYLQLRTRFAAYAVVDLLHAAARWLLAVAALAAGYQSASMMVGAWAVAPWVVALIAAATVLRPAVHITATDGAPWGDRSSRNAVIAAAGWTVATTAVGAVVARLDLLVLGAVAGAGEAGIFAAASTLALVPTMMGAYLAPAFSGRILPYCHEGRMDAFLRRMQVTLIAIAVAGTLVGIAVIPAMTGILLPGDYGGTARVVPVLLIAGAAGFVTFPLVLHTLLLLSPRTYLFMDLLTLPILVPMYVVAARRSGAIGVAWVTAVATVIKACIAQIAAAEATRRAQARFDAWPQADQPLSIPG
jgi:O-antigen/teichoic acid export membrane protein